jgi:putative transcriptional regulator
MSAPRHHPTPELIVDYARGAITQGRALVLDAHFGACADCRASLRIAEAVGGALLAELEPAEMAPAALTRALAAIERPPAQLPNPKPRSDWIKVPEQVLFAAERRKRWAAPGVWVAPVTHDPTSGARSYLLRVGRGIAVPMHTHSGDELVCVVKGAYEDRGQTHGPGDFSLNDGAVQHQPRVTRDGECVCLIATDHALVPRSLTARLFQPLVRI